MPTQTTNAPCRRRVRGGGPCYQHRGPRQPLAFTSSQEEAIAFAVDAAIDGWEQAAADRLVDTLGDQLWTKLAKQWRPGNCKLLAEIARGLLKLQAEMHEAVGELADQAADRLLERFQLPTIEREIMCTLVRTLGKKLPLPTDAPLAEAARALRVLGVYICVPFDDLGDCPCLKDLIDELGRKEAKKILQRANYTKA